MLCPQCGTENEIGSAFCISCKTELFSNNLQNAPDLNNDTLNNALNNNASTDMKPAASTYNMEPAASNNGEPDAKPMERTSSVPKQRNVFITAMNNSFAHIFYKKNSAFYLLILAAFFGNISFIPETLILYFTKMPVPDILHPVFTILSAAALIIFMILYIHNETHNKMHLGTQLANKESNEAGAVDATAKSNGRHAGNLILTSIINAIFIVAIILIISNVFKYMTVFSSVLMQNDIKTIIYIAALIFILFAVIFVLLSATVLFAASMRLTPSIGQMGLLYRKIVLQMLKRFPVVIIYCVIFSGSIYLANGLENMLTSFLNAYSGSGFMKNFIFYLIVALLNAYLLFLTVNISDKLISDKVKNVLNINSQNLKKKNLPIFAITAVVLTVVMLLISIPLSSNTADLILNEAGLHINKGDLYRQTGNIQQAGFEYSLANSELLSLDGYIKGIKVYKENRADLTLQSQNDLKYSVSVNPQNRYIPYFQGRLLMLANNPDEALKQFEVAASFSNYVPGTYFSLLTIYNSKANNDKTADTLNMLANSENYYDSFNDIENLSTNKSDGYLEQIKSLLLKTASGMAMKATEKSTYYDMQGALNDLTALLQVYPDNAEIYYDLAKVSNIYRNEQSNYKSTQDYVNSFDRLYDTKGNKNDEINKKLFVADMYQQSGDLINAENILSDLAKSFPGTTAIELQYAKVLNANKKSSDAITVLKALKSREPGNIAAYAAGADCYLSMNDLDSSLKEMSGFVSLAAKDPNQKQALDSKLYTYCISFYKSVTADDKKADAAVSKVSDTPLLFNYLNAIKGWKLHDMKSSQEYIDKVIEKNPDLGFAYYVKGIDCYEDTVKNNQSDFSNAEKYYLKSLQILPQHAEGYFSLGHCYLKWGKNLEALRAFRKAADLMPFQDHSVDSYGLSVHSKEEINALIQYDEKEVD